MVVAAVGCCLALNALECLGLAAVAAEHYLALRILEY
jgi:hypothetical protein